MIDTQDDDEDGYKFWHALHVALLIEGVAVALFFACAFIWLGVLSGRI